MEVNCHESNQVVLMQGSKKSTAIIRLNRQQLKEHYDKEYNE